MKEQTYIGQLNRRIWVEQYAITYSETGQETITWSTLYTCWAKVEFLETGSNENFLGDQQVATTRARITIRHRDGLDEKMRISYNGQTYDIRNINETPNREYIVIITEKRI